MDTILNSSKFETSCIVEVKNRNQSVHQILKATNRKVIIKIPNNFLNDVPRGEGERVELTFFKIGRVLSFSELENEYMLRGLEPADIYTVSAFNYSDRASNFYDNTFTDSHPHLTYWKNKDGSYSVVCFGMEQPEFERCTHGTRFVRVSSGKYKFLIFSGTYNLNEDLWFAGVSKKK
jgi:hypothetical protein